MSTRGLIRLEQRLVSAVQGDLIGVVIGAVRVKRNAGLPRTRAVRVLASRVKDDNTARAALVAAMKPANRRGLLRLVDAALWDARGDEHIGVRRSLSALVTLSQLAGQLADWRDVVKVANDIVDEDFAQVWRVGLRSGMKWQEAWSSAKRLSESEVWEMAAALCRTTHIQDVDELEVLCSVVSSIQVRSESRQA
jgi:hypothetical protein